MNIQQYINNNYYPLNILQKDVPMLFNEDDLCREAFSLIQNLYQKNDLSILNEDQLEEEFIKPILSRVLGYEFITQEIFNVHGKELKPDYLLFDNENDKQSYRPNQDTTHIISIFEAKRWGRALDTKVIDNSPHMQLVQYNLFIGVPYGILSNGKEWRFYDLTERKSEKIFFEIDLEEIIKQHDYDAFQYFYYIFRKKYFIPTQDIRPIDTIAKAKERFIQDMENDLKEVIYGKNSIVEKVGRVLARSYPDESLGVLFEHSVVMAYRLLFVAYFESKFNDYLFDDHEHYKNVALMTLFDKLRNNELCKAYQEITNLFDILDNGSVPFKIPLLNGGLFDMEKAPLFEYKKNKELFTNQDITEILENLLIPSDDSLGIRNFAMMSVTHIGNVYEGLLQYTFRISEEIMYYLEYSEKSDRRSGYYDMYDYHSIAKKKDVAVLSVEEIPPQTLYLVNSSNSRKISASYYTPQSLSRFMVKDAVKTILDSDKNLLDVRIIDNACGSGHFLVDILDELTEKVYAHIEDFPYLSQSINDEKAKIVDNLEQYQLEHLEIDELQVLKRLLLKKVIYGVDLQEFAVELTRLSLWLKTFIFGTPLSFIEHHIKQGNSLIGSSIEEGNFIFDNHESNQEFSLYKTNFRENFKGLEEVTMQLVNLADNTTEEIEESKKIYRELIEPKQKELSLILDLITYDKMRTACKRAKNVDTFGVDSTSLLQNMKSFMEDTTSQDEISRIAKKYSFFHYDIAFPEVKNGFDIVVGNPPWDKVIFDEKDFFPQYRSNYRTMSVSQKKELRTNLLSSPSYHYVQEDYHTTMTWTNTCSAYYYEVYPKNKKGHPNLFRLFIEKNISLLTEAGRLIYVTPSAWSYEDSSFDIRKHIIDTLQFNYFYQFENREGIFPDVDSRYKFAIWSISNIPTYNESVPALFMQRDTSCIYTPSIKDIQYPLGISRKHFPNSYIMLEINDEKALTIIEKMYSVGHAIDPSYIDFRQELNMTNDKDLFIEEYREGLFPLVEGKMIHQFNPHFAEAQYWVEPDSLRERLLSKEISRMIDSVYDTLVTTDVVNPTKQKLSKEQTVLNHLKLSSRNDLAKFVRYDYEYPRMFFRAIAANTNERTLISTIVKENCSFGHSMFSLENKSYFLDKKEIVVNLTSTPRTLWVNALFNSIVFDFILRNLSDMNVTKSIVMQLPLIHATDEELQTAPYKTIWQNALALTAYNAPEFKPLAEEYNISIPQTDKARTLLQIQNDIAIAKLYGITPEEMSAILDTFKVLSKNKPEFVESLRAMYGEKEKSI